MSAPRPPHLRSLAPVAVRLGVGVQADCTRFWNLAVRDDERPFVRQAKRHLAAHLAEPFSLAELAGVVGVSPSHLRQAFAADVGVSPSAYLAALRVDRAADLLRAGRPVKEVAAAVGFCDPSHLTRRFKRLRGTTPARYAVASSNPVRP